MVLHRHILGDTFSDERGTLNFFNNFDMSQIVRLYEIMPSDTHTIRAWQGHQNEKKWFYCNSGTFIVNLIKLDNFEKPSKDLAAEKFYLEAEKPSILEISGGYATGFKAVKENSKLLVFSNFSVEESKQDDYRYPVDTWKVEW